MRHWFRQVISRYISQFENSSSSKAQSISNACFYFLLLLIFLILCICCLIEPWVSHCPSKSIINQAHHTIHYSNPMYDDHACRNTHIPLLLGLTPWECDMGRRILLAILLGAIIGYERRTADRPAGLRLMSVISLGSACFTISSMFCFEASSQSFDSARVAAAIPSGVGFLGSALIWKGFVDESKESHQVHGLTTSASVWISAAIGCASAGGLFFCAMYTTFLMLFILRFGPRNPTDHAVVDDDPNSEHKTEQISMERPRKSSKLPGETRQSSFHWEEYSHPGPDKQTK